MLWPRRSEWVVVIIHNRQCISINDNQAFDGPERKGKFSMAISVQIVRVVDVEEPPLELVLNRGLADPPLAVQQQAVVVNGLQDTSDQLTAAEEHVIVHDRGAGDIGIEFPAPEFRPPPVAAPQRSACWMEAEPVRSA